MIRNPQNSIGNYLSPYISHVNGVFGGPLLVLVVSVTLEGLSETRSAPCLLAAKLRRRPKLEAQTFKPKKLTALVPELSIPQTVRKHLNDLLTL